MVRPSSKWVWGGAIVVCALLPAAAQVNLPKLPRDLSSRMPTLSSLVSGESLTTSIEQRELPGRR